MRVVFDANLVFAGAGWRGEAYHCLLAMARRHVITYGTEETIQELQELVAERGYKCKHSPQSIISWYIRAVRIVAGTPIGRQRSRDPKDDLYLACALAARAEAIVTYDKDLLELKRPFGVRILRPAVFLKVIDS